MDLIDNALTGTWCYFLDTLPRSVVTVFGPFISLIVTYVIISGILLYLELTDCVWLKKYKIQKDKVNPPHLLWKCFRTLFVTFFILVLPNYYLSFNFIVTYFGFSMERVLPTFPLIVLYLIVFVVMEDFTHYWLHRFLHLDFIYKYIHAQHHEFLSPTAMSATYAHPLEVIILGFCTISGPLLFRPHMGVFLIWMQFRQLVALETHLGYDFPFSANHLFPGICGGAPHHDFHHKFRKCNFASTLVFWDRLFGTDTEYEEWVAETEVENKKIEAEMISKKQQ